MKKKILVIEDNEQNLYLVSFLLERYSMMKLFCGACCLSSDDHTRSAGIIRVLPVQNCIAAFNGRTKVI